VDLVAVIGHEHKKLGSSHQQTSGGNAGRARNRQSASSTETEACAATQCLGPQRGRKTKRVPTVQTCTTSSAPKRRLSRTRIVMGLLLIVAIPIFIGLANKTVHENAEAIRQGFGQ
jgi:hypothetical protein